MASRFAFLASIFCGERLSVVFASTNLVWNVRSALAKARSATQRFRDDLPLNLSGVLSSPASLAGHERASGVPVFMVTTPWGSPYMLFERRGAPSEEHLHSFSDFDYVSNKISHSHAKTEDANDDLTTNGDGMYQDDPDNLLLLDNSFMEARRQRFRKSQRNVALFFTDENDAKSLLSEMKTMGPEMRNADIRITATNMARALRQSSILGDGLPSGGIRSEDGVAEGHLRYKFVPSARQLYYASRCRGRERVGFFDDDREELIDDPVFEKRDLRPKSRWNNWQLAKKKGRREPKRKKPRRKKDQVDSGKEDFGDAIKAEYAHMKGKVGVPVFCANGLHRMRGLPGRKRADIPFFFSYEDCAKACGDVMRNSNSASRSSADGNGIATPDIEVYNFLDVATSIDKDQHNRRASSGRWTRKLSSSPTDNFIFVPPSRSVLYKDSLSALGNGKARLRAMR